MRTRIRAATALLLLCFAVPLYAAPYRIHYLVAVVAPSREAAGKLHVAVRVAGVKDEQAVRFQMPVWSPGDYHIQNHAQYVRNVRATVAPDHETGVSHPDANTWEAQTGGFDTVLLSYDIPNEPASFFSENARVASAWAFYNGPAVYMYVEGHKQDPVTLQVALPPTWKRVVTPLAPSPADPSAPADARFTAPDYDTLADSPVAMGDVETREFSVAGRPHTAAFFRGAPGQQVDGYLQVLERIVAEEDGLMGGPPYPRYVFFFDVGGITAGLEHLNAARIGIFGGLEPARLAGLAAHEFYHLWNVKRIRPEVLGPFDYIHPPRTRNLWFCEGVTSYYGDLSVLRCGLSTERQYLAGLAREIGYLQSNPARLRVSADESSLRVWEANNSDGYGGLSYYLKGELIGLCLDLQIRFLTGGRRSLDDVMRDMLARYGLPKRGYPEDGIRDAVIRAAGPDMGPFYDRLARSTEELPLGACLEHAGLRLQRTGPSFAITEDPLASPDALQMRRSWLTGRVPGAAAARR